MHVAKTEENLLAYFDLKFDVDISEERVRIGSNRTSPFYVLRPPSEHVELLNY